MSAKQPITITVPMTEREIMAALDSCICRMREMQRELSACATRGSDPTCVDHLEECVNEQYSAVVRLSGALGEFHDSLTGEIS